MLESFHMFSQRRWVGVAFVARRKLADVRFLRRMSARMLEAIRWVRICLVASLDRTQVRLLARVRANMDLQIFCPWKALRALGAMMRLLFGMCTHMDEHLVARIESALRASTILPHTIIQSSRRRDSMSSRHMTSQILQRIEMPVRILKREREARSVSISVFDVRSSYRSKRLHAACECCVYV